VRVGITGLAEVRGDAVELAPPNDDVARNGRIDGHRGLVGGIAEDVVSDRVCVDLNADVIAADDDGRRLPSHLLPVDLDEGIIGALAVGLRWCRSLVLGSIAGHRGAQQEQGDDDERAGT
jgi:hypothetical protein